MRAVVDTNIVVSALIQPLGNPGQVLDRFRQGVYALVTSHPLLDELRESLARSRLRRRLALDPSEVAEVMQQIIEQAEIVRPTRRIVASRDPDDDRVLEAAVAGRADIIVSGDRDLLALGAFENIPIVTAADFLALLAAERLQGG